MVSAGVEPADAYNDVHCSGSPANGRQDTAPRVVEDGRFETGLELELGNTVQPFADEGLPHSDPLRTYPWESAEASRCEFQILVIRMRRVGRMRPECCFWRAAAQ